MYINNRLNPWLSTGLIKIDLFQHYRKNNEEDVTCQGQHNCHICFSAPTYIKRNKYDSCALTRYILLCFSAPTYIGPRSAVGNVSGYRCVSDCNPRGRESIPARSHTFVEIDHEIISTVILFPSTDSFKKGCCQLQAKVCARITGYPLVQACPGKSVTR